MKLAKHLWYKLIIVLCIIAMFSSFIASTPVYANQVNKTDFYYSGTRKGSYTVSDSNFISSVISTLEAILDYLLGLCTMGVRMVFVGWTALFERCLTLIIKGASGEEVDVDGVSATNIFSADGWITLDAIFFNHIPLLDINFFNMEQMEGYDAIGSEIEEHEAPVIIDTNKSEQTETTVVQGKENKLKAAVAPEGVGSSADTEEDEDQNESLIVILKKTVAGWYYSLRLISIMVMLVLLMYIGIKIAMQTSAADKAVYKKMLVDWVVGMIFVFFIHYIMLFIITVNETIVESLEALRTGTTPLAVYEYGLEERAQEPITNEELELTLYDEVKTRAYDIKMSVGTSGMVMYMVLVYYAWKFTFIYLKRYLTVAVLTIMAPLVAVAYAYNRVRSGKSIVFTKWLKEYTFIVLLQSIHALIYLVFVQTALAMSLASISGFILTFVLLNFMSKAEGIFRKIFGIDGSLTKDIAEGAGIRDTIKGLKATMGVMTGGKIAATYTKGVAKAVTAPARALGGAGFKGVMKHRAKRLDNKALEYGESNGDSSIKTYSDMKKAKRNKRTNTLHIGNILENLENGNLNIEELEEEVDSLNVGDSLYDENGTMIGIVDDDYIKKRRKEVNEIKAIASMRTSDKDKLREEYQELHKKNGDLKQYKIYFGDKWEDIMDPSRYVMKVGDKYKSIETKTEYGEVHGRFFTYRFGKKIDSATLRFAKQLKLSNLTGITKDEKKALLQQLDLIKSELLGFSGILVGIPLMVAEPKVGMVAMTVGISQTSKAFSGKGIGKVKDISHYSMDAKGNYTFNRFEGASKHTMAEGAKCMARRTIDKINNARIAQDEAMKAKMNARFPKMAIDLKRSANTGAALSAVTAGTIGIIGGLPAFTVGVGAVASATLTGSILKGRYGNNAWASYQDTMRVARKANAKALEKAEKNAETDNFFADEYLKVESQEYAEDAKQHSADFAAQYALALETMKKEIEQKTDAEVFRDTGYEEPIEVTKTPEGKPKIALDSENKLIDNAIILYTQQSGLMDVAKLNVEDKMDDIEKILKTDLVTRGIIKNDEEVSTVIENLESRVKDRQVKIEKSGEGKKVVQEKIAGDAIVSTMQEKGTTDPTAVTEEEVLAKFLTTYQESAGEALQSGIKTNSVLESLNAQKLDGTEPNKAVDFEAMKTGAKVVNTASKAVDVEAIKASAKAAITAKKASYTDKAKQKLDTKTTDAMKEMIKKKQQIELDKKILEKEDELESAGSTLIANEDGGVSPVSDGSSTVIENSGSTDIVKMLQLQTELYKDKKKLAYVEQIRGEKPEETLKSMSINLQSDGSKKIDTTKDGSRKVPTDIQITTDINEILKRKKQELKV